MWGGLDVPRPPARPLTPLFPSAGAGGGGEAIELFPAAIVRACVFLERSASPVVLFIGTARHQNERRFGPIAYWTCFRYLLLRAKPLIEGSAVAVLTILQNLCLGATV